MFYNVVATTSSLQRKIDYIKGKPLTAFDFRELAPDARRQLAQPVYQRLWQFAFVTNRATKFARRTRDQQAVYGLSTLGVSTNRDEWVYDFSVSTLRDKALFFADNTMSP